MKRISKDEILKHLAMAGTCSAAELAEHFDCSISQIHYKCDEMVLDGRLEQAKRPVKVTRVNGRTYTRDAVKVYCIRVQPPVATPETKPENDAEAHQTRVQPPVATPETEPRFTFPARLKAAAFGDEAAGSRWRDIIRELEAFKADAIARHPDLAPIDYEAYREALVVFFRARGSKSDEDHVSGGGILTPYHKEHIRGLIAASQLLSKGRSDDT